MIDFKIGDKVTYKGKNELLGHVSSVFKGQLFALPVPDVRVHIGFGEHIVYPANELEIYKDE